MSALEINIDGASKGNPGPSGVGVIICRDGVVIKNISQFIGEATNNIAEYTAFIYALQEALILKGQTLKIKTDSELLAKQINGEYKVKHKNIIPLYTQAKRLMTGFKRVEVTHVMRENNCGADKLADLACQARK